MLWTKCRGAGAKDEYNSRCLQGLRHRKPAPTGFCPSFPTLAFFGDGNRHFRTAILCPDKLRTLCSRDRSCDRAAAMFMSPIPECRDGKIT